ncbi:uncharacterized protein [Diabrotica undecimpunctata]|uniref:uncharacterized protein n=1 Tax=Diabrotica undecimpunctata TaxID=50387 RepID=UPI003B63AF59
MRVLKSNLTKGKSKITKIKNQQGNTVTEKTQIIKETQTFYENLCTSAIQNPVTDHRTILNVGSETLPKIASSEIRHALQQMKNKKAPDEDRLTSEILKMGGNIVVEAVEVLLNKCLTEKRIASL